MAGVLKDTAEAVRADLQTQSDAGTFIRTFTAERSHADWDLELTDPQLHVDVCAVKTNIRCSLSDRGTAAVKNLEYTVRVDVVVRKSMAESERQPANGRTSVDEVDQLDLLVEQIHAFFARRYLTDYDNASWTDNEPQILESGTGENLRKNTQYFGMVRLEFSIIKTA